LVPPEPKNQTLKWYSIQLSQKKRNLEKVLGRCGGISKMGFSAD
jgi:hypothetical protein